jgi:cell division protein FtsB
MLASTRLSRILQSLALNLGAALIVGYFAFHAYHGNYGLIAQRAFTEEIAELSNEYAALQAERTVWEHRIGLMRADRLDPDLLEELARRDLGYARPNDLVLIRPPR